MRRLLRLTTTAAALMLGVSLPGTAAETPRLSRDIALGAGVWTETDLTVQPGEQVALAAQGGRALPRRGNELRAHRHGTWLP